MCRCCAWTWTDENFPRVELLFSEQTHWFPLRGLNFEGFTFKVLPVSLANDALIPHIRVIGGQQNTKNLLQQFINSTIIQSSLSLSSSLWPSNLIACLSRQEFHYQGPASLDLSYPRQLCLLPKSRAAGLNVISAVTHFGCDVNLFTEIITLRTRFCAYSKVHTCAIDQWYIKRWDLRPMAQFKLWNDRVKLRPCKRILQLKKRKEKKMKLLLCCGVLVLVACIDAASILENSEIDPEANQLAFELEDSEQINDAPVELSRSKRFLGGLGVGIGYGGGGYGYGEFNNLLRTRLA